MLLLLLLSEKCTKSCMRERRKIQLEANFETLRVPQLTLRKSNKLLTKSCVVVTKFKWQNNLNSYSRSILFISSLYLIFFNLFLFSFFIFRLQIIFYFSLKIKLYTHNFFYFVFFLLFLACFVLFFNNFIYDYIVYFSFSVFFYVLYFCLVLNK